MYLEAIQRLLYCAAGGVGKPQCERTRIIAYFTGGEQYLEASPLEYSPPPEADGN